MAKQLEWAGMRRDTDTWKRLLTASWLRARGESVEILPALDGHGVDVVFRHTSKLTRAECAEGRADPKSQQLITVPSTIYNQRTGETKAYGGQVAGAEMPSSREELVKGQVYQTARGPARWDGSQFQSVR